MSPAKERWSGRLVRRITVLAWCVVAARTPVAAAQEASPDPAAMGLPLVVLLDEVIAAPRSGLLDALRIRLTGRARVDPGASPGGERLPDRLASARAVARATGAAAVLWIEAPEPEVGTRGAAGAQGDEGVVMVCAVTPDASQALVESARMDGSSDLERSRLLALKLAELLEVALAAARERLALARGRGEDAQPFRVRSAPAASPAPRHFLPLVEVSSALAGNRGGDFRPGLRVAAGFAFGGSRVVEVALSGAAFSDAGHRSGSARNVMREQNFALGVGALWRRGGWSLGGDVEGGIRRLAFSATAADGRAGNRALFTPAVSGALEVRRRVWTGAAVRLAVGASTATTWRTLTLDGAPAYEIGGIEPRAFLGLVLGPSETPW